MCFSLFLIFCRQVSNMFDSSHPTPNKTSKITNRYKPHKFILKLLSLFLGQYSHSSKTEPKKAMLTSLVPLETITRREEVMKVDVNDDGDDDDVEMRVKRSVKGLSFGREEEEKAAAMAEMKKLMVEGGGRMRRVMAELGVIPSLVEMVFDFRADRSSRRLAVEALVELANGSFRNKKLIVDAEFLSKLSQLINSQTLIIDHQFVLLLLSISSLSKTPFPISPTNILPLLLQTLASDETPEEIKLTSISTLHNLSTNLASSKPIATSGLIHALLASSTNKLASEESLSTLGNLVLSSKCKKLIENDLLVPKVFIEILAWEDKPKCQEIAAYLLMIIAHRSSTMRARMERLGVVNVLVEVALLGSPLARKRAIKLVEWLKDEKRGRIGVHSGPQARRVELAGGVVDHQEDEVEVEASRRAIERMVKQSLDKNMKSIMMRASGGEGDHGLQKVLAVSSRSKSMPY